MWGDNKGSFLIHTLITMFLTNTMAKIAGPFPKSTQQIPLADL